MSALGRLVSSRAALAFWLFFLPLWSATLFMSERVTPTYESTAVVAFQPRNPLIAGAETMTLVAPKYVELVRSPEVLDSASTQLGASSRQVQRTTTGQIQPNTLNLQIVAEGDVSEAASAQANALAARVVSVASQDPLLSGQIVAWAVPAEAARPPSPELVLLVGFLASLLLGATAANLFGRPRRAPVG